MGGYAVEIDLIHYSGCMDGDDETVNEVIGRRQRMKQSVDGLFVQRSDAKSVKCGESIPQLASETAKLRVVHILKGKIAMAILNLAP